MQKEENVLTILDMVSNGEISPDEGVDLLEALKAYCSLTACFLF